MAYTHLNHSNFRELRFMQVYLKSLNVSDSQAKNTKPTILMFPKQIAT